MKIERRTAGNATILDFAGEFDAFNLPTVGEEVDQLILAGGTRLVLNLRQLKFINSTAIGYLIKAARQTRELKGELVVSEPSKFFQTTIKTLGIDQLFKTFPNDEEAVRYLGGGDSV